MKFLITGGAGFIGSHLALYLYERNHHITIIDDFSTGNNFFLHNYEIITGNINNLEFLKKKLNGKKFDYLVHLASKSIVSDSFVNKKEYMDTNIFGTKRILELCSHLKINKVIFSSTAAVYGSPKNKKISEDFLISPINPYGKSKIEAEKVLKEYSLKQDFDIITFRFFNACGGDNKGRVGELHKPETHLIPKLMQYVLKDKKEQFIVYGNKFKTIDGFAIRDYLHVLDICDAVDLGVKWLKNNKGYQTINLGSGTPTSVLQIIKSFEQYFNKKIDFKVDDSRIGEPDFLLSNIQKANVLLNWIPKMSNLNKIIEDTYTWQVKLLKKGVSLSEKL